jgi:light-regulated signal transduction histidine kinase (bacteriophytochrome)
LEGKVKQLDKSNQSLQEFVYFASHDLQEPLRKISTFVGRLDQRFQAELPEEGRSYLSRIINATQNMQRLLEDLLAFSRLSFEERSVEIVNLNNCVRLAISDLEIKIEDSGAQISGSDLPFINGHPHQIKQLFLNLLSNAIKFRKAHTVPQIRILCAKVSDPLLPDQTVLAGAFLELKIMDNGIGFDQLFAEKIFTIFQRLNGKTEYTGSGIGLAICRKIVENHGGKIYANSEIGQGASFTILLPANY